MFIELNEVVCGVGHHIWYPSIRAWKDYRRWDRAQESPEGQRGELAITRQNRQNGRTAGLSTRARARLLQLSGHTEQIRVCFLTLAGKTEDTQGSSSKLGVDMKQKSRLEDMAGNYENNWDIYYLK